MDSNALTIESVQSDLPYFPAVVTLFDAYRQFYGQRSDLEGCRRFLTERLRAAQSDLHVALWDGEPVGFVQCYPGWSSLACAPIVRLNDLFILPAARGRGVARALIQSVMREARGRSAHAVVLETGIQNHTAQALYRQLGFVEERHFMSFSLVLPRRAESGAS